MQLSASWNSSFVICPARSSSESDHVLVPEPMRSPEARAGFLTSLDKLEEHLADLMRPT